MNNEESYSIFMPTIQDDPEQYKYVRWAVIYGLATRKYIHKYIENAYESNRILYYQAYKKSNYSSINFSRFTTETSEVLLKVAGIMAWSEEEGNYNTIFSFIEKGYKTSWKYLKRYQKINLPHFYEEIKMANRSDESNFQAIMGLFICSVKGFDFVVELKEYPTELTEEIEGSTIAMAQLFLFSKSNYDNMTLIYNKEQRKLKDEERTYLKERLKKWQVKTENQSLMHLIKNYKISAVEEVADLSLRPLAYFQKLEKDSSDIYYSSDLKTFSIINAWLEAENISWYDFHENYELNTKSFEKIAVFIYKLLLSKAINEQEEQLYFSFLLIIDSFKEAYRKTQDSYYNNRIEEVEYLAFEKEQELTDEWKLKENQWRVREKELKEKLTKLEYEKNIWKKEAESTRKKISVLETELEKAKQSEKELGTLKKYLATTEKVEDEKISMSVIEDFFRNKKIIIIGGDLSWQQKLKANFPGFIIWDADDVNRDFTPLNKADAICLCWTYMSHPMYWKAKKQINKHDLTFIYTGNHKNLEKTIIEIYKNLTM